MNRIEAMDRAACARVMDVIGAMLKASPELRDLGVAGRVKGARFDPANGTLAVTLDLGLVNAASGERATREAAAYRELAALWPFNLPADGLGREVVIGGLAHTIVGLLPRSRRTPVLLRRVDGKVFKYPADVVRAVLGTPAAAPAAKGGVR